MRRAALALWGSALLAPAAWADCAASVPELVAALDEAEAAYTSLDLEHFRIATDRSGALIECLNVPLSPAEAARYHRLQGLRADLTRDPARAQQAFAASRRLEPDYQLPDTLLPPEHPLRLTYGAMPLDSIVTEPLPPPRRGQLVVDGADNAERPANVPAVIQWEDSDGTVGWSDYVWPEERATGYPAQTGAARRALLITGAATALASGASYLVALQASQRYHDLSTPIADVDRLRATTNTGMWLSIGGGVTATGVLVGALVLPR